MRAIGRRLESTAEVDRRVRRTKQALVKAFVALMREKSYDDITIRNLLDRADVGRSTFYAHYRGKDDLLQRSFEEMLSMLDRHMELQGASNRVVPVKELFQHVWQFKSFHQALVRARIMDRQHQAHVNYLSQLIESRLANDTHKDQDVPRTVLAHAMASGLLALLKWWMDHGAPYSPERMDALFHSIYNRKGLLNED